MNRSEEHNLLTVIDLHLTEIIKDGLEGLHDTADATERVAVANERIADVLEKMLVYWENKVRRDATLG